MVVISNHAPFIWGDCVCLNNNEASCSDVQCCRASSNRCTIQPKYTILQGWLTIISTEAYYIILKSEIEAHARLTHQENSVLTLRATLQTISAELGSCRTSNGCLHSPDHPCAHLPRVPPRFLCEQPTLILPIRSRSVEEKKKQNTRSIILDALPFN